jgi:hypothetical protein
MGLDRQLDLFLVVLQELAGMDDLMNKALEVFDLTDGSIELEV